MADYAAFVRAWLAAEELVTPYLPIYRRFPLRIVRGEGAYLIAESGQRILDFAAGIAVNSLGHGHPKLLAALKSQADDLWHCSNQYMTPQLEKFSQELVDANSVFFCSSGTEAVEAGIKFMRRYHYENGEGYRQRIITFEGGFHGRTYGGIAAGGNDYARAGFGPMLLGFDRVPFGDMAAVKRALGKNTAGILLEPIQGEGGVRAFGHDFLREIRALCDAENILLMCDEVQCGYGRPGSLFAYQQAGITPDIVTAAKGIGGGFPLGATLVTTRIAEKLPAGCHGSTYGSNPLAMVVGSAVLEVLLADGFFAAVHARGEQLKNGLQALQKKYPQAIAEVRGVGLMVGLLPSADGRALSEKLLHAGLATAPSVSNVIRFVPPLNVSEAEIGEALSVVESVLANQH
jgi:acetylornithine/N-succinyldiaminopimelate aminotransferase